MRPAPPAHRAAPLAAPLAALLLAGACAPPADPAAKPGVDDPADDPADDPGGDPGGDPPADSADPPAPAGTAALLDEFYAANGGRAAFGEPSASALEALLFGEDDVAAGDLAAAEARVQAVFTAWPHDSDAWFTRAPRASTSAIPSPTTACACSSTSSPRARSSAAARCS